MSYEPSKTIYKTGEPAGIAALVLGILVLLRNTVELPWTPENDAYIVSTVIGLLTGLIQGGRNWYKNKDKGSSETEE